MLCIAEEGYALHLSSEISCADVRLFGRVCTFVICSVTYAVRDFPGTTLVRDDMAADVQVLEFRPSL